MSDDVLAALISFGVPGLLALAVAVGVSVGRRQALAAVNREISSRRDARVERWAVPPSTPFGEVGTPERLLSDYEDAIFAECRHHTAVRFGGSDEGDEAMVALGLHAEVRRVRTRLLYELSPPD